MPNNSVGDPKTPKSMKINLISCFISIRNFTIIQNIRRRIPHSMALGSSIHVPVVPIFSIEENKNIVQRFYNAGNAGDMETCMGLIADDIRWTNIGTTALSGTFVGKKQLIEELLGPLLTLDDLLSRIDREIAMDGRTLLKSIENGSPVSKQLDKLFGPVNTVEGVLQQLDESYKAKGILEVWFSPTEEPISPFLADMLGPVSGSPKR